MPHTLRNIHQIDALLPQTQCTKCGYDGCLPYATAIAKENAPINRCPPGGEAGIRNLARLLNLSPIPLDTSCGKTQALHYAVIDEMHCIGCTLCIKACPVDAIVGANKFMHSVIADLCSGCERCLPVCPVDCIEMIPANKEWSTHDANASRERHQQRATRLLALARTEEKRLNQHSSRPDSTLDKTIRKPCDPQTGQSEILGENQSAQQKKSAIIAMALAKARERQQAP